MNELGEPVRDTDHMTADFRLWYGNFLSRLPDSPDKVEDYCRRQIIPVGTHNAQIIEEHIARAAKLLTNGFIPSPSEFDLLNTDVITDGTMDRRFGSDQWNQVFLMEPKAHTMRPDGLLFITKTQAWEHYPELLHRLADENPAIRQIIQP